MVTRRDLLKNVTVGTAALIANGLALGAGSRTGEAADEVLNVGQFLDPDTLDPDVEVADHIVGLLRNVYEPLVDLSGGSMKLEGVLATRWSVSPDAKQYTFGLRRGVKFSDGTPSNASAAKRSIERILTLRRGPYWVAKNITSIEIPNEYTLTLRLSSAFPLLGAMRLIPMMSPTSIASRAASGDEAQGWLANHSAGTGAYSIDHWTRGQEWVLVKNPVWRGWASREKAHKTFARIVVRNIPEVSTQSLMLKRGDLDVGMLYSGETITDFKNTPGIAVNQGPSLQQLYITLNAVVGPTKDVRVRQALNYAWDPKALDAVIPETFTTTDGPIPRELLGAYVPQTPYRYDLNKAKQLLAAAGYPNGGFTLTYWSFTGDEVRRLTGELLASQLGKLGISVKTKMTTSPAQISGLNEWMKTRDSNTATSMVPLVSGPRFPDPYAIAWVRYDTAAASAEGRNWGWYSDPSVDKLIAQGATLAADPEREQELYGKLASIILEAAPDIFAGKYITATPMRDSVRGYINRPANSHQVLFYDLWRA